MGIKFFPFMNRICNLFNIKYPIIQGGMIWCSGWELASAVSNAGGLGLIGSGSMYPDILRQHIQKCKSATDKPFGVNIPLLYPQTDEHINIILEEGVKIVFTSAGNPKIWTSTLKENGIKVAHVVSSLKFGRSFCIIKLPPNLFTHWVKVVLFFHCHYTMAANELGGIFVSSTAKSFHGLLWI